MRNIFLLTGAMMVLSCGAPETNNTDNGQDPEIQRLKEENVRLQNEVNSRDSSLNASIQILNEIEENLAMIREKESAINLSRNNDPELQVDQKDRIIEEIQTINSLMEENKNKLANLRSKMKKADMKISELEKMVDNLLAKISSQDSIISTLRDDLSRYDIAMDELTATLNETMAVVEEKEAELNTAYYVSGSTKELKEQGIITKEGGFIGLGKIIKLREDFNKDYFTKLYITHTKEIILGGKEIQLLTTHPKSSYNLTGEKVKEKLVITDPEDFWSISKYLVVVVD